MAEPRRSDLWGVFLNLFYCLCRLCSIGSLEMEREEIAHSEDPNSGVSSSSTPPHGGDYEGGDEQQKGNDYEVFLSFRGKDTRKAFTDHLYNNLVHAGIRVFRDDNELRVGEEIGQELFCSIKQSKISIPIISENYASSKWCLRELAQMLKCKKSGEQIVLPIFYKVKPSQVRHLTGRFRDAANAHKKNLDKRVVKEWEEALKEVGSLKGWESDKIDEGHEGSLVTIVVRKAMSELKRLFQLNVTQELVGIDHHMEQILSLIGAKFSGTSIIGIFGMGGIGKTTLAKVLYNKLSSHFEHLSFVANVRETSRRKGIECLQKQLISDIIRTSSDVSNVDEGIGIIKSRFSSKKVLVLLDDMDDNSQLNALVGDGSWFSAGSIVIITTRNKSILDKARAAPKYQLNELPLDQSLILFSRHTFRMDSPPCDYEVISHDIVSTTGGLPLTLEVVGSFLCGKTKEVWNGTLKKLQTMPHKKVQDTLRISYDELDSKHQRIFLDIACFFIGSSRQNPTYMWDACGFFPEEGIEVLSLMSLIKIDDNGNLMMHDQLRDLGREIVRLENEKKPQKRSRLWIYEEVKDVLDYNKGTSKIEALHLDKHGHGRSYIGEQFKEMINLRFLQANGVNFTGDFQNLLPQLSWLQWEDCPSDFTAANFQPKKLVVLDLLDGMILEDWGGWSSLEMATNLKVLNLEKCISLRRTPDLSAFKSLEILILRYCINLEEIHTSIGNIKTLVSLNVSGCWKLQELLAKLGRMEELRELILDSTSIKEIPISRGGLMKLETLSARHCNQLAQLPESIGALMSLTRLDLWEANIRELPKSIGSLVSLTQLDLFGTEIKELPESIGFLKKLGTLNASSTKLACIPSSLDHLASLSHLNLSNCDKLAKLPDSIGKLASLTELDLSGAAIAELPESIRNMKNLRKLNICRTPITELPGVIVMLSKLQELDARSCKNLKGLPGNIGELVSLQKLYLKDSGLLGLPELPSGLTDLRITCQSPLLPNLSQLTLLRELELFYCTWLECLPELPAGLSKLSIRHLGKLKAVMDLSHLTHLSGLFLDECFEQPEATGVEGYESVSESHAGGCPKTSGLDAVESLGSASGFHSDEAFPDSQLEGSLHLSNSKIPQVTNASSCVHLVGSKSSERLNVSKCESAGQSLLLSCSKYLRSLSIMDCKNLTEIRGLDRLESLEELDISGCVSLRESLDLSNLKNLRTLRAIDCKNLVEIRGLGELKSLRNLNISGCTSLRQSDLSNLQNLQEFRAENCENLVEVRGLDGLKSLHLLAISGCKSLRQSIDLSNLQNLLEFRAGNCENLVEVRGLDGLESLRLLAIFGCRSLRQSMDLSNLQNLREFRAGNCENLVEIQGLDELKFLRVLDISGCISLRQSLDLSKLKMLQQFRAENCKNLVEVRGLDRLESLLVLIISGCLSLRQSLDLSNLKSMRDFKAENCENLVVIQGL